MQEVLPKLGKQCELLLPSVQAGEKTKLLPDGGAGQAVAAASGMRDGGSSVHEDTCGLLDCCAFALKMSVPPLAIDTIYICPLRNIAVVKVSLPSTSNALMSVSFCTHPLLAGA